MTDLHEDEARKAVAESIRLFHEASSVSDMAPAAQVPAALAAAFTTLASTWRRVLPMLLRPFGPDVALTRDWLSGWLLLRCIDEDFLEWYGLLESGYAPAAACCTPRGTLNHIADCALVGADVTSSLLGKRFGGQLVPLPLAVGPVRLTGEARLRLVCEMAHRQGVPRAVPLAPFLGSMHEVELVAYSTASGGAWRQDAIHAQDVSILGGCILQARFEETRLVDFLAEAVGAKQQSIAANWYLAALLHDAGACIDAARRALRRFREHTVGTPRELLDCSLRALEDAAEAARARESPPSGHHVSGTDHGWLSKCLVEGILSGIKDSPALLQQFLPSTAAMAAHNEMQSVSMLQEPTAALLILCDRLQDWGRPRFDQRILGGVFAVLLDRGGLRAADVEGLRSLLPDKSLFVTASVDADGNLAFTRSAAHFRLETACGVLGLAELAVEWVDACLHFQRLRLSRDEGFLRKVPYRWIAQWRTRRVPDFSVEIGHTYDPDFSPSELSALADFARERQREFGCLGDWVEAVLARAVRGIEYSPPQHVDDASLLREAVRFDVWRIPEGSLQYPREPSLYEEYHAWKVELARRMGMAAY